MDDNSAKNVQEHGTIETPLITTAAPIAPAAPLSMFEMAALRAKYREETRLKAEEAQRISDMNSPRCSDNWVMKQDKFEK
mmetsp:Transcript_29295/g.28041  ORF Transcript_29295/g.28041 Transcript_29295/m.28041 type:complete len:80 (-) Transcript_29295:300-539(-)